MKYVQSKKEKKYLNPIPIKLFIFPKVYIKKKAHEKGHWKFCFSLFLY